MSAPLRRRMEKERERHLPDGFIALGAITQELPEKRKRGRTQGVGITAPTPYQRPRSEEIAASIPRLTPPPPSPEALASPARRKAEAEGWANSGYRTWFLVFRAGAGEGTNLRFRAIETLDDAPGWSLVQEMRKR